MLLLLITDYITLLGLEIKTHWSTDSQDALQILFSMYGTDVAVNAE